MDKKLPNLQASQNRKNTILILGTGLVSLFIICNVSLLFLVLFYSSTIFFNESENRPTKKVLDYEAQNLDSLNIERRYIDPNIDSESNSLLERSTKNFIFEFEPNTNPQNYLYEKEFIIVNLQSEYERLSALLDIELNSSTPIIFTDDQEYYENEIGFDYADTLYVAGSTSYDEILFLVNPEKYYTKEGLNQVLAHELVHHLMNENIEKTMYIDGVPQLQHQAALYYIPNWLAEGAAQHYSLLETEPITAEYVKTNFNKLFLIDESIRSGDLRQTLTAYNLSQVYFEHLLEKYGQEVIIEIIAPSDLIRNFSNQYYEQTGSTPDDDYENWLNTL